MSSQHLIELFRRQVELQPTATAVQDESFTLTYSELERWSNNLGHEICSRLKGTGGSSTIAIYMPRSVLLIVSVLAVVKIGLPYLPLDPSAPSARLTDQVLQSDTNLLLTVSDSQLSLGRAVPFNIVPFINNTCSTGRPKGVLLQHAGMTNFVNNCLMEIQPGDRVAMVNNPSFDASSLDIWDTLCHGGTIFVFTGHLADSEAVVSFFREKTINKVFLPTAVFHHVVSDIFNTASLSTTLRLLIVGGERLATAAVKSFFRHAPDTRLVNIYGPTEATICTTTFELSSATFDYDDSSSTPIPVGRCIPNTVIYLLDENLRPVDPGLPGEICIGGIGLAAGYLGQDQSISDKFVMVNDLEGDGSSIRLYRTHDIGKFVQSGRENLLQFIGRNDNQVKIRGQRLEPGEIEAVLCAGSDNIDQAAVVVTESDQLVAYVVQKDDADPQKPSEQAEDSVRLREIFYAEHFESINPALVGADFTGWVSMYDGVPIPRMEMQDWLSDTLRGIQVEQNDSVLEIGCGTGMILFSLESRCQEYYAMDMLGSVLAYVQAQLTERGLQDKVTLLQGKADELDQLLPSEKRFNLIILNSVVQYFPSADYLENVLRICANKLHEGGRIFLGDIRHLGVDKHHDLARVLHCDPSPELPTSEIRDRLAHWQLRQLELKVNPSFFFQLQEKSGSRISHVEILPKMMSTCNELSQFRYQIILHIGKTPILTKPKHWMKYTNISKLEEALCAEEAVLAVNGIPNSLVALEQGVLQLMSSSQAPAKASELIAAVTASDQYANALSPCGLAALCARHNYQVDVSFKSLGVDQTMAAVFSRGSSLVKGDFSTIPTHSSLTNCPTNSAKATSHERDLITRLHNRCRERLPSYMVPHRIIIQKSLPLTGNGKVDRRMLAEPRMWMESKTPSSMSESHYPENETQAQVQACIARVLKEDTDKIPLQTDFVALGLHSFRAPALLDALRDQFSIPDLPFRVIFQCPNIKALSGYLEQQIQLHSSTPGVPDSSGIASRQVQYSHDALHEVLERRGLTTDDVEDIYETTLVQQMPLMAPSRRSYMMHQVVTAHTDINTFVRAVEVIISRHTILRSTIFDNLERQVVFRYQQKLRDEMVHVYPAEEAQFLEDIIKDDDRYALAIPGNLIKFEFFRTDPPTLLIIAHHAILDEWSKHCLLREIDQTILGEKLPEPIPFRHYVEYVIANGHNSEDIAWHVERLRTADIIGFPSCDTKSTFSSSSCLGPNFLRVEQFPGMAQVVQTYGIKPSTLFKIAFALIKRNETKMDTVLIPQVEACRSLPIKGISDMCAPTFSVAIDRVDFLQNDTVLGLLRRTQSNQEKITDISVVDYGAVFSAIEKDLTPLATSGYNFFSLDGRPPYKALQLGPAGAENDIGVEWATIVEGEQVTVKLDHDPVFSDRIPGYVDQFFTAARWLLSNIQAQSFDGLQL
ncbi:hypothetical protein SERLA73DRAFT_161607 [Serpula lacrymans var. lacrymans S7.3]|uniref:Carrier domain-containing protein n=2 Tax=Serpula lacrymans var. lacrymans TaxID=341189 RepID=F8Q399_SERL3|nr:putative nonribosomal peptide synthetase [Serpula lacrymans var. lacrymans S7.9]EGN97660.1 hypothetical protein SERLA73DRAFT_161607 [Serpula lacrymans var. lacrymans S7.3]EGO23255.1 putative nonribosomal peptide synthetase [Serpula lacrymans var. lacrymans S7.9]